MDKLELYIFDYNYSSWSMRAGVILRASGLAFAETMCSVRAEIAEVSASKLLPLLRHGELRVWDSLAIAEYIAELSPERNLWPKDRAARAQARSASAEMHSGFAPLRSTMGMNLRAHYPGFARSLDVERNITRVKELWTQLRSRYGAGGDYLCGEFGIVDAMFVPVVARFRSYDVKLDSLCETYACAVERHPAVLGWLEQARADVTVRPEYDLLVDTTD